MSLLGLPAVWVALEYARSHIFSGFGWNLLAYSQTPWWRVIQVADVTGAWGVSFLIVCVNVALAHASERPTGLRRRFASAGVALGLLATALGYGAWRVPRVMRPAKVRVAVLQGNVPQIEKWDESYIEAILAHYELLTCEAVLTAPQLIVWPETAVPGYLGLEEALTQRVTALARAVHRPLLVGAPMAHLEGIEWRVTNSAVFLDAAGGIRQRYEKLHLVPFGEFLPLDRQLPWLRKLLPPIGDFQPGREPTVFRIEPGEDSSSKTPDARQEVSDEELSGQPVPPPQRVASPVDGAPQTNLPPFSVLICFEDVFPELARGFVRAGARWLLVITNDAWFGPTAAAYQHAQASTFRAVELRVPVARAANTGWSGAIDAAGRWVGSVHASSGKELFVAGIYTGDLALGGAESLYLRWGDWFAWTCVLGLFGWCLPREIIRRQRRPAALKTP